MSSDDFDEIPTENGALLAWAAEHPRVDTIDLGFNRVLVRRLDGGGIERWEEHSTRDPAKLPDPPDRVVGTTEVYTTTSYVDAVKRYENVQQITYVDQPNSRLVTVLNPTWPEPVDSEQWDRAVPGHSDHRVSLKLRHTPEFLAWMAGQGLHEQTDFARRMQDGELEIVEPAAATMLEIAETFHATGESVFKSASRLQDGRRQFRFEEDSTAKAGADGTVEIPERFTIAMPIYVGGERYQMQCRLTWQLRPTFRIGYTFIRPEVVLDHAFTSMVEEVTAEIAGLVLLGPAPA